MDGAGQQFFSGSSLALDQYRCVRGRDRLNLLQYLAQSPAFANNVLESILEIDLILEIFLLLAQAIAKVGNLTKDHRITDRHRHLVSYLNQHLGFLLAKCALDPAGYGERADRLAAMHQRYPATRLHAEAG